MHQVTKMKIYPSAGHDKMRLDALVSHYTDTLVLTHDRYYLDTDGSTYATLFPVTTDDIPPGVTQYWKPTRRNTLPTDTIMVAGILTKRTRVVFSLRNPRGRTGRPRSANPLVPVKIEPPEVLPKGDLPDIL